MTYTTLDPEASGLIFGRSDLSQFEKKLHSQGDILLYHADSDTVIDRSIYEIAADYLRKAHGLKRNVELAMNETTKTVLLDEAREQLERSREKEWHSSLLPLISTMTNMDGFQYSWSTIWDMKIHAFMDAVNRLQHIKNVNLLLSSGYSGFGIDLKKLNKKDMNYFTELNED